MSRYLCVYLSIYLSCYSVDEVIEVDELNEANKFAELFHTWTQKIKTTPKVKMLQK